MVETATIPRADAVTLENLRDGAAVGLFDEKLQDALANIRDERTDPKKARKVVLTVELAPLVIDEQVYRNRLHVNVKAEAKLAAVESGEASHSIRSRGDGLQLVIDL